MNNVHNDDEDDLTRRFKTLFNKEPVSQSQEESRWKVSGVEEYDFDDEELGRLVEESAALDEKDVTELIDRSTTAVKDGRTSKSEVNDLLNRARSVTEQSQNPQDTDDISEDEIAALLQQLEREPDESPEHSFNNIEEPSTTEETNLQKSENNDSAEIAAILAQLTDAARLEQKFGDSESGPAFPSVSSLSPPSAPKASESADDDLSARLANLKSFQPKTYTGTDRGSINVFIPGLAKNEEDETIHWCVVCNDDATIECLGCEGDLYCDLCFKEGHNLPDTKSHRWRRYRRKATAV